MLYTALILGLVSSLHCVGMCGPIAMMLPYTEGGHSAPSFWNKLRGRVFIETLTYNIGRIVTYTFLGLLFGFLGRGLAVVGFSQALSVLFGLLFIVVAIKRQGLEQLDAFLNRHFSQRIRGLFAQFMKHRSGFFALGMLNGLMPCGIVYWAIAASLMTFNPIEGAAYMSLFGLGTMPLMLATVLASRGLHRSAVRRFYRFIPVYQFALGVFLIYRAFSVDPSVFWMLTPAPVCH
ncbi:MAG: sulfite exporter TauE/SafE family protein [Saprospiraceae bacterium]|nr:sulfite exporter TauE/SafE family protein [Saprospiraceae bacterium]